MESALKLSAIDYLFVDDICWTCLYIDNYRFLSDMRNISDMKNKVDIIVSVYNYGHFLGACLNSVIKQTYGHYSVLIIDNASTDNSEEIARSYVKKDNRLSYIRNESNLGSSASQIKAYHLMSNDFVLFLSADDQIEPSFLEKTVAGLESHPTCAFSYTLCNRVTDGELVFGEGLFLPELPTGEHDILKYLAFTNWIYPSFCLTRRVAIEGSDVFRKFSDPRMVLRGLGDHFFWLNLSTQGNAFAIHERLGKYRLHSASETTALRKGRRDIVELTFLCDYIFCVECKYELVLGLLAKVNSFGRLATNFGIVRVAIEMLESDKFSEIMHPVREEFLQTLLKICDDFVFDVDNSLLTRNRKIDKPEHIEMLRNYLTTYEMSAFEWNKNINR